VAAPDDLPEFAEWIATLRKPGLSGDERERIIFALHDFFDPEEPALSMPGSEENKR
jgi:hypothetical protein